ncbi:hypothetical protein [Megalodesulfovibrio paquesii]
MQIDASIQSALFKIAGTPGNQTTEDQLAGKTATAVALAAPAESTNMLAGNFVQHNAEPSRYILGKMVGFQVRQEFGAKLQGLVASAQIAADAADSYAERSLIGQKAANAIKTMLEGEVSESEAERMTKEREEATEKAEARQANPDTTQPAPAASAIPDAAQGEPERAGEAAVSLPAESEPATMIATTATTAATAATAATVQEVASVDLYV